MMTLDYALGGLVAAALLFYLTFALLRPERF
ncbi:K(+)-transporting ATPase subunit F [Xanthobacter sp. AM11]